MISAGTIAQSKLKLKAVTYASASTQFVTMGNHPEYDFESSNPFSLSFWIKFTSSPSFSIVCGRMDTLTHAGSADLGYSVSCNSGKSGLLITDGFAVGANYLYRDTDSTWNDGAWHHIVWTYDGSATHAGMLCYVDGASAAVTSRGFSISGTIKNLGDFQIAGRKKYPTGYEALFDGAVSDVAVYSKALSSSEVTTIYASHCPPRLESVGPTGSLVGFWRPSLTDTNPTITDLGSAAHNGTMTNMSASNIYSR